MADLTATFETGLNGNSVETTDAGSATAWNAIARNGGGTITYDSAKANSGTLSAAIVPLISASCYCAWTTAFPDLVTHYGRFYLYLTGYPGVSVSSFWAVCDSSDNPLVKIRINTSGQLIGNDAGGNGIAAFTNAVTLNQWVRIEYMCFHSATVGQYEIKLFNTASSTTPTETGTSAANRNTGATQDRLFFGVPEGGVTSIPLWLDDIVGGATSYPGPVVVATNDVMIPMGMLGTGRV